MDLTTRNVTKKVNEKTILKDIDVIVKNGEFVGILGPNGSGKSSFLKTIYRTMKPDAGWISLANKDIYSLTPKEVAKQIAVVTQESSIDFDFTVQEILMMGRYPHKSYFQSDTNEDLKLIETVLQQVGMEKFATQSFFTLSGGEKQRVLIARAMMQQSQLLVLDEPTNHLDIQSQINIMLLLKQLNCSILTALHDLNIASIFCDRLYLFSSGEVIASGTPYEVFRPDLIRKVFNVETEVRIHPQTLKPHITFLPISTEYA